MQANVGGGTKPETLLRSRLHGKGLRFRKEFRPEPGLKITADIVFPRIKLCIFVDGCFWHGCPNHFSAPKTNTEWWREKIASNKDRDFRQSELLIKYGWTVLRYWEHEILSEDIDRICSEITKCCSR